MEASQAGLGQGAGGADAAGGEDAGGGIDAGALAQIQQQVQQQGTQFAEGLEGLRGLLQQTIGDGGQQQQEDDGLGDLDLGFLDPAQPGFDPAQMAGQLQEIIDQRATAQAQRIVQQQVNPLQQRIEQNERMQAFTALVDEFPELGEEGPARQIVGLTRQFVESSGWPAAMADDPTLMRVLYLAGRATDAHNEEEAQGPDPGAALLGPGRGASPQGLGQGQDLGELITGPKGRRGAGVLPF